MQSPPPIPAYIPYTNCRQASKFAVATSNVKTKLKKSSRKIAKLLHFVTFFHNNDIIKGSITI